MPQWSTEPDVQGRDKSDNSYEIPVIYSEVPGADYDPLHTQPRSTTPVVSSGPARPSISKSPFLWGLLTVLFGLLTVALAVVTIGLLVIFLTSLGLYTYLSHASFIEGYDLYQ